MNICTWTLPRELFSFQIPLLLLCSHPSSFILCRYSFIFCQRPKQIPKDCSEALHGFLLSFNPLLLKFQLPQALQLLSLSHQVSNTPVPCLRSLSSHTTMQTYLQAERQDQRGTHLVCFRGLSEITVSVNRLPMSVDYCPVYSFPIF